jgi:integrase
MARFMGRYGSGSLFPRGKKKIWYYQAWVNGKQIGPKSSRSSDRKVAERELDKLLGKRARGELLTTTGNKETINDLVSDYLAYADERLKSARIIRWVLESNVVPKLGALRLASCDVSRLRRYRKERTAEGADDTTCNRELSYLRAAWRRALKEGFVNQIPYFPIVKEDNARQGFVEESDFLRFLSEIIDDLKPFAVLTYYGGMRRGEILKLRPEDLNLLQALVVVRPEIAKNETGRLVPILDGPMMQWLTWCYDRRTPGQKQLIVWSDGRPVTTRNFYGEWHRAANAVGLPNFIPHDSRRSASRNMRNEGIQQIQRMKILGHKTDSMDRRYSIFDTADVHSVRETMNRRTTAKTTASDKVSEFPTIKKKA